MKRSWLCVAAIALCGCGVSKSEYDAKVQEATAAKQEADAAKQQVAQLQQQVDDATTSRSRSSKARSAWRRRRPSPTTRSRSSTTPSAPLQEAQDRGKLLDDLQTKFKKMIDAGHLKVTTRHGRIVLQLHNDVLFATGEADLKPDGKQAIGEVASTLKGVGLKRFQVAGTHRQRADHDGDEEEVPHQLGALGGARHRGREAPRRRRGRAGRALGRRATALTIPSPRTRRPTASRRTAASRSPWCRTWRPWSPPPRPRTRPKRSSRATSQDARARLLNPGAPALRSLGRRPRRPPK